MITSILASLWACQGDDPTRPGPEPSSPLAPTLADEVRRLAEAEGFVVGEGLFTTSTFEHCCHEDANCFGNNPSTPYGVIALPPAPDAQVPDLDSFWAWGTLPEPGVSRSFRLRSDEAYVWIGTMPPRSRYWSYRSSIATRASAYDQRYLVLGSLGPSLNHLVVAAERGLPPSEIWQTEMAIVTASDEGVEERVVNWLIEAGMPPTHIHLDRLSSIDARFGLEQAADTFMAVMRVAVPDDPEALERWQQQPDARVLRLTPSSPIDPRPMGRQPLPPRGSGENELPWVPAMMLLAEALRQRWPEHEPTPLEIQVDTTETYACIYDASCAGDIRDRHATRIISTSLPDDESFLVIFGLNHERTGRASYSNFAVMTFGNQVGVLAVDSSQMVGSARAWLGDTHPQVDDLFAWVLSRDCARFDVPCLELPEHCPYPGRDDDFYILSRLYLDPATGAAPSALEVVPDQVWAFRPR